MYYFHQDKKDRVRCKINYTWTKFSLFKFLIRQFGTKLSFNNSPVDVLLTVCRWLLIHISASNSNVMIQWHLGIWYTVRLELEDNFGLLCKNPSAGSWTGHMIVQATNYCTSLEAYFIHKWHKKFQIPKVFFSKNWEENFTSKAGLESDEPLVKKKNNLPDIDHSSLRTLPYCCASLPK